MRRDQQIIPPRSTIQFGDDDDLHARAHVRARNKYKFAHAPAAALVATYAKAQANIVGGGGGGGGGASRARCAGAQIGGIAPPERGRPTSSVAFNVSSIARYAGAVQRARHERRRSLFVNYPNKKNARARRAGQRPHRNEKWPPSTFLNGQIQAFRDHYRSRCGKARFVFGWLRHFR